MVLDERRRSTARYERVRGIVFSMRSRIRKAKRQSVEDRHLVAERVSLISEDIADEISSVTREAIRQGFREKLPSHEIHVVVEQPKHSLSTHPPRGRVRESIHAMAHRGGPGAKVTAVVVALAGLGAALKELVDLFRVNH